MRQPDGSVQPLRLHSVLLWWAELCDRRLLTTALPAPDCFVCGTERVEIPHRQGTDERIAPDLAQLGVMQPTAFVKRPVGDARQLPGSEA